MTTIAQHFMDFLAAQSLHLLILFAAVLAVTMLLRHKTAHLRYLLWLLIVAKCLIPPLHTIPLAVLPEADAIDEGRLTMDEGEGIDDFRLTMDEGKRIDDFRWTRDEVGDVQRSGLSLPENEHAQAWAANAVGTAQPAEEHAKAPTTNAVTLIAALWLGGATVYILAISVKGVRFERYVRRQRVELTAQSHPAWAGFLAATLPNARPFRLYQLSRPGQPFVWGLWRGAIYLPSNFADVNDPEKQQSILMHEAGHILRLDPVVNLLQVVAQGLFWFHPLVWAANRIIRAEREKCCDEFAVATLKAPPRSYCTAIVDALMAAGPARPAIPTLAVAGPVKNIEDRIKTLLTPNKRFYTRPTIAAMLTILLVAVIVVPTTVALSHRVKLPEVGSRETDYSVVLPNGVMVQLIGICEYPSDGRKWWKPDGSWLSEQQRPYEKVSGKTYTINTKTYEAAFKLVGVGNDDASISVAGHGGLFAGYGMGVYCKTLGVHPEVEELDLKVGVACGPWQADHVYEANINGGMEMSSLGEVIFARPIEQDGKTVMTVSHRINTNIHQIRLIAIDKSGNSITSGYESTGNEAYSQLTATFNLPIADIKAFLIQTRPYEWLTFKNVSLRPGVKTGVEVVTEKPEVRSQAADFSSTTWNKTVKGKVYLPDLESKGVNTVLDLASGQMLSADEMERDGQYFQRLGKGDIVYEYANNTSALLCLRGAKMQLPGPSGPEPLEPDVRRRDFDVYFIRQTPCGYLLTTAEGNLYQIDILSIRKGDSGGAEIEFWKAESHGAKTEVEIEVERPEDTQRVPGASNFDFADFWRFVGSDLPKNTFALYRVIGHEYAPSFGSSPSDGRRRILFSETEKEDIFDASRPENYPLPGLILDKQPLFTEQDIVWYDWQSQQILLKPEALRRLPQIHKPPVNVFGVPFMVAVNGQRIYLGAFWTSVSSRSSGVPTIELGVFREARMQENVIEIWGGGIRKEMEQTTYPQRDWRIRDALASAGLLKEQYAEHASALRPDGETEVEVQSSVPGPSASERKKTLEVNLKSIFTACQMYNIENGKWPESIEDLQSSDGYGPYIRPNDTDDFSRLKFTRPYVNYRQITDPARTHFVYDISMLEEHKEIAVVYLDGHIEFLSPENEEFIGHLGNTFFPSEPPELNMNPVQSPNFELQRIN